MNEPDFLAVTEAQVRVWQDIEPPNEPARRMAAGLTSIIEAFEAQRHVLAFEDEPSSFEAALLACKEPS